MQDINKEGFAKAEKLLSELVSPDGFLASPTQKDNYRRVWARDGVIIALAAALTDKEQYLECFKNTLKTLARFQGAHGEIPSNVDAQNEKVSYGGTTGRVDANLWFIIGAGQYLKRSGDLDFIQKILPAIKKCIFLLGAWEFNQKGLLYVPPSGDWADEYIHQGYILYDEILYYVALKEYASILAELGDDPQSLKQKAEDLKATIRTNFWLYGDHHENHIYHKVLYEKGLNSRLTDTPFWSPFFSPVGYGFRFDSLANTLVSLFDIADEEQRELVDEYIESHFAKPKNHLLPAFDPVIAPIDEEWKKLQMSFSYTFKNRPYEFHNGGLWPMVTAFYVADLVKRDQLEKAHDYETGINNANFKDPKGEWGFYEFLHGKDQKPMGTQLQGWSITASIYAHYALNGKQVFL
jgi:glycogen debranching enzyme